MALAAGGWTGDCGSGPEGEAFPHLGSLRCSCILHQRKLSIASKTGGVLGSKRLLHRELVAQDGEPVPRQPGGFDRQCETLFYWNTDFIMKIAGVVCF